MSEQKVPLPELPAELEAYFGPAGSYKPGSDDDHVAFISIAEMREYALSYGDTREQAGWNAALEWAARQCEDNIRDPGDDYQEGFNVGCCRCADAIRALKGKQA